MYPWELDKFIKDRGNRLGGDDLLKAISIEENPQLNHIVYNPYNQSYEMWDYEGNYYHFSPIPIDEVKQKTLVKKKERKEN